MYIGIFVICKNVISTLELMYIASIATDAKPHLSFIIDNYGTKDIPCTTQYLSHWLDVIYNVPANLVYLTNVLMS